MSLFYLSNDINDKNGKKNNDYQTTFRTPFSIPPLAKVSIEGAFIPLNAIITIVFSVNDKFNITLYEWDAVNEEFDILANYPLTITIPAGQYSPDTFASVLTSAITTELENLNQADAPLRNTTNWSVNVSYGNNVNEGSGIGNYTFNFSNVFDNTSSKRFKLQIDMSQAQSGTDKNNLAVIVGLNNVLDDNGNPVVGWGIEEDDVNFLQNGDNPGFEIQGGSNQKCNGPSLTYFSTNILIVEIQELGTQLFNSIIKDKQPAVCVIPYSAVDINNGFVLYKPPFPLELHSANEVDTILTTLSVKIREGNGTLANVESIKDRTYVVLRLETTQDLEKESLHLISKTKRLQFLANSLVHKLPK